MSFYSGVAYVTPLTKIRRQRVLPHDGELAVTVGQQVSPLNVIARAPGESVFRFFNAAEKLGIPPENLSRHLLVGEGAAIKKGTPIMRKRTAFGGNQSFGSPLDGVVHRIVRGRLIIRQAPQLIELRALLHGIVVNLVSGRGAVVEASGSLIQCLWGSGEDAMGKLRLATTGPAEWLIAPNITHKDRDAVLVAGRVKDTTVLEAMKENGVKGLIVGSMPTRLCLAARRQGLAVMVTDDAGTAPMATPIFRLLEQSVGRDATLLSDEAAAPGSRPEIIIPLPTADEYVHAPENPGNAIRVNQTVRVIRAPHVGVVGRVLTVHDQPQRTPAGNRVSGADVELESGEVLFVPASNLELII